MSRTDLNKLSLKAFMGSSNVIAPTLQVTSDRLQDIREDPVQPTGGYKSALPNSKLMTATPVWRSKALKSRLQSFEELLVKLRDPQSGVAFKDQKNFFGVKPCSAKGADISACVGKIMKYKETWPIDQLMDAFIGYGYLIPVDSFSSAFKPDDTLYTFQADLLYFTKPWDVSDLDYGAFLLRKSSKSDDETQRLAKLQIDFEDRWKQVKDSASWTENYVSMLDKLDKKLFELRETAFWRVYRPTKGCALYEGTENSPMLKIFRKRWTDSEFESKLPPKTLIKRLDRRQLDLTQCISNYRITVSTAAKILIYRATVWEPMDVLCGKSTLDNPWRSADTDMEPDHEIMSTRRAKTWAGGFRDLLNDPLGVEEFTKFLDKDFSAENLEFYFQFLQLQQIMDRSEYLEKAKLICNQYIVEGAPHEINIVAAMRDKIMQEISKASLASLDIYIFHDAVDHVYHLMQTASYTRFLNSEAIKKLMGLPHRK